MQWMESFATDNIPSSLVRSKGYEELARKWPEDRLTEAVEWLTSRRQGVAGHDPARSVVAKRLTKSDPVEAIDDAMEIADRRQAEPLIINAARNLYRNDPDTVIDWLPESGLPEAFQQAILRSE